MRRRRRWSEPRERTPGNWSPPKIGFGSAEWIRALSGFTPAPRPRAAGAAGYFDGWWEKTFADRPTRSEQEGHACGEDEMLMIVAYDIMDPRRLQQVAKHCEDYGIRVQYSVFECRLKAEEFDRFWQDLCDLIDPAADRLVSYRICARCAQEVRMAGTQEVTSDARPVAYVF